MTNRSSDSTNENRFSLEIERGSEEEPSSFAANRPRPGSRATSSRASSSMSMRYRHAGYGAERHQNSDGGIQILQDGFDDEEEWLLEDMSDAEGHDLESMDSASEQSGNEAMPQSQSDSQGYQSFSERYTNQQLTSYRGHGALISQSNNVGDFTNIQQQLMVRDPRAIVEVDTDEENDIVNKIKTEITQQVRGEISDEIRHLTNGHQVDEEDNGDIDPKIKEALVQMRKFDRILEKRTKRERRVKRERIALQKRLKEELEELNKDRPSGCKGTKDEAVNTERFLSLPPSIARFDKEVAERSEDDDEWSGAPVFATEPPLYDTASNKSSRPNKTGRRGSDGASSTTGSQSTNKTGNTTDRSKKRKRRKERQNSDGGKPLGDKDFIQRNIDLAADAGNTIAMTDDEKKRLADILEDLDEIDETLPEEQGMATHSITVRPGDGFSLDNSTQHSMNEIDQKLGGLIGQDEYNSIMTAPSHLTYDSLQLFSRTHNHTTDITEIGERALQENREYRDQQRRLGDIERELANLSTAVESEIESPRLTDQQLSVLLEQCNRMMSRATIETDSLSQSNSPRSAQSTARESTISTRPQLQQSVLQALLDQARAEGIVSRVDREHQNHTPDENSSELISADQRESLLLNPRTTSRLNMNGTL